METSLVSFGLIERDEASRDARLVWSYPYPGDAVEKVWIADSGLAAEDTKTNSMQVCNITGDDDVQNLDQTKRFFYNRFRHLWHYLCVVSKDLPNSQHKRIDAFGICLRSKEYHPKKYFALLDILSTQYFQTGEPTYLLEAWISATMKGVTKIKLNETSLSWKTKHYAIEDAVANTQQRSLSSLYNVVGTHIVKIWHALCLRQRVIIYGNQPEDVMNAVCTLPQLLWHRRSRASGLGWDVCRPLVSSQTADVSAEDALNAAGALSSNKGNICGDALDYEFASAQEIETEPLDDNDEFQRANVPISDSLNHQAAVYQAADLLLCGNSGGFIAGVATDKFQSRNEWYDLWIDIVSGNVQFVNNVTVDDASISASAQEEYSVFQEGGSAGGHITLTGIHAMVLDKIVKAADSSSGSDNEKSHALVKAFQQVSKKLRSAINETVSNISEVSPEALQEQSDLWKKLGVSASPECSRFLYKWALAEGDLIESSSAE